MIIIISQELKPCLNFEFWKLKSVSSFIKKTIFKLPYLKQLCIQWIPEKHGANHGRRTAIYNQHMLSRCWESAYKNLCFWSYHLILHTCLISQRLQLSAFGFFCNESYRCLSLHRKKQETWKQIAWKESIHCAIRTSFWQCTSTMAEAACTATIRMCWSICIPENWK